MMTTSDQRELIDLRTVAVLLGVSTRTVLRLRDSKQMPQPVRLGSLVRWRRAEILDWIATGCPTDNGQQGVGDV